jgi:metal-responsive CopG/Arc/MetJ family transcriptional regulator
MAKSIIAASVSPELAARVEQAADQRGYRSRSALVADALTAFLADPEPDYPETA